MALYSLVRITRVIPSTVRLRLCDYRKDHAEQDHERKPDTGPSRMPHYTGNYVYSDGATPPKRTEGHEKTRHCDLYQPIPEGARRTPQHFRNSDSTLSDAL